MNKKYLKILEEYPFIEVEEKGFVSGVGFVTVFKNTLENKTVYTDINLTYADKDTKEKFNDVLSVILRRFDE